MPVNNLDVHVITTGTVVSIVVGKQKGFRCHILKLATERFTYFIVVKLYSHNTQGHNNTRTIKTLLTWILLLVALFIKLCDNKIIHMW